MACVLHAASAVKLVDDTLWRVIIKKRKGSLEAYLMADRRGVLQENSVLTGHKSIDLLKPKAEGFKLSTEEKPKRGDNSQKKKTEMVALCWNETQVRK